MWISGYLDYSEFPNIRAKDIGGEYFAKRIKVFKILCNLMGQDVENLDDHGCPKVRNLVDMLELPNQTENHNSLCRAQGRFAYELDNAAFNVEKFLYCGIFSQYLPN